MRRLWCCLDGQSDGKPTAVAVVTLIAALALGGIILWTVVALVGL